MYASYITDHEIKPLNVQLEIKEANGQLVPYSTFLPDFLGSTITVDLLALLVPDVKSCQSLILVNTNTLDPAYQEYCDFHPNQILRPSACGYESVIITFQHRHKQSHEDPHTTLQLNQPCPISAGSTTVIERSLATKVLQGENAVISEHPISQVLPGGLLVKSCLYDLPRHQQCHFPVVITNESNHAITIPARTVIGEVCSFKSIHSKELSIHCGDQLPNTSSSLQYDFVDSPLSPTWTQSVINRLNSIPEVFARHDLAAVFDD